jgi:aspartate/methionine/tyrosine aminotransferase
VLAEDDLDEICRVAEKIGAWVLCDEVYRGTELDGHETPTLLGRYKNSIATGGLSKAYGLPGLRIGWIAAKGQALRLWGYRDYTTIAPGALNDYLARCVLQSETRRRILERTRGILRSNLKATAISYLKYSLDIESAELARRLLKEKKTLVVPGKQFHMGRYLRIGYGGSREQLEGGLARVGELFESLKVSN